LKPVRALLSIIHKLAAMMISTAVERALIVRVRPEMSRRCSNVLKDILTHDKTEEKNI
jgi:hypothetical protein